MSSVAQDLQRLPRRVSGAVHFALSCVLVELARPGTSDLSGRTLWAVGASAVTTTVVVTNLIGVCAVLAVALLVIPLPGGGSDARLLSAIVAGGYVLFAVPLGAVIGTRQLSGLRRWLLQDRPASVSEQQLVLSAPLRLATVQLTLWFIAAAGFGLLNLRFSTDLGVRVAGIVALTGVTTASCSYLLTERLFRPVAARALAQADPEHFRGRGVATRLLVAWACGTGVPVLGLGIVGVFTLAGQRVSLHQVAVAIVVLSGTGLLVGFLAVGLAARATADPLDSVRHALARVQSGDFSVEVPVYDATQVGLLQRGFNQMVVGLAERERIREAFGTYVDPDVADHVLREGTSLEGEDVEVTIMFMDVRGFTPYAESHSARQVVTALNRLFEAVVPIIHEHQGRVDKYIGDGLLAVFGAPRKLPDHADCAVTAAVQIAQLLSRVPDGDADRLEIGIGLNSGTVVAGNLGAPGRVEFSVIGDAVNVAARIEAATRETDDVVLVAGRTQELLKGDRFRLEPRSGVSLKGKSEPVTLYGVILPDRLPVHE